MRWLQVVLLIACGGSSTSSDGGADAGVDAGRSGPPWKYFCEGYDYCLGPDGGEQPVQHQWHWCADAGDEARAASIDAGKVNASCRFNFGCRMRAADGLTCD